MAERILIVEDDPTLRRVLRDNLIFEGYRVDAVSDGKSAINYVRASAPDLVVLDLTLPDFDGLDLCARCCGNRARFPSSFCRRAARRRTS